MKEAIGGSWLFTIVIILIALFAGFVSLSTNYSRTYKVKDEVLASIERNHGVHQNTLDQISEYMIKVGYRSEMPCVVNGEDSTGWVGFLVNDNRGSTGMGEYHYCIKKNNLVNRVKKNGICTTDGPIGHPDSAYYSIVVFFKFDMPVINNLFSMRIKGETSTIFLTNDDSSISPTFGSEC